MPYTKSLYAFCLNASYTVIATELLRLRLLLFATIGIRNLLLFFICFITKQQNQMVDLRSNQKHVFLIMKDFIAVFEERLLLFVLFQTNAYAVQTVSCCRDIRAPGLHSVPRHGQLEHSPEPPHQS